MNKIHIYVFLLVIQMMLIGDCMASWEPRKNLEELVNGSKLVVLGKTVKVNSQFVDRIEGPKRIVTYVEFSIKKLFKGSPNDNTVTVLIEGGQIGNLVIAGERTFMFKMGDEALLFLDITNENVYEISGISGALKVTEKGNSQYFDCSMLASDLITPSDGNVYVSASQVINRVSQLLSKERVIK